MEETYSMEASSRSTHCFLLCAQNSTNGLYSGPTESELYACTFFTSEKF